MAYAVFSDIRLYTNLEIADLSDANCTSLIAEATAQVNRDTCVDIIREQIGYIDVVRDNLIDGSNKTFYIDNWEEYFISDRDNDGDVDKDDIIVYQVTSAGVETVLTVSSVDDDGGNFTLDTAPSSGVKLYVTYRKARVRYNDPLLKRATCYLTASIAYAKINLGKSPKFKFGNTMIERHMGAYKDYIELYRQTIDQINRTSIEIAEVENII